MTADNPSPAFFFPSPFLVLGSFLFCFLFFCSLGAEDLTLYS